MFVDQPMALLRSAKDRVCLVGEYLFFQGQQSAAHWQYIQKYTVHNTTEQCSKVQLMHTYAVCIYHCCAMCKYPCV